MAAMEMNQVLIAESESGDADRLERILEPEFDLHRLSLYDGPINGHADQVDILLFQSNRPGAREQQMLGRLRSTGYTHPVGLIADRTPGFDVYSAGFDAYLEQPFDPEELREVVRTLALQARYDSLLEANFILATEIADSQSADSANSLRQSDASREAAAALITAKAEADEARKAAVAAGVLERAFHSLAQ